MKTFTYSEARQNLAALLDLAESEDVQIRRRDGSVFVLRSRKPGNRSPFDVAGIDTDATTDDVLNAIRESRQRR